MSRLLLALVVGFFAYWLLLAVAHHFGLLIDNTIDLRIRW